MTANTTARQSLNDRGLAIASTLLHNLFRHLVTVEQAENFRLAPAPVIFAYNHNNYFETIVLGSFLMHRWRPARLTFLVDWMYGRLPILGRILNRLEPVYVYTKRARWDFLNRRAPARPRDLVSQCLERLQQGWSLGIFPEGTRNPDPLVLRRGRRGVGELVLRSRRPVVPVGIDFPRRRQAGKIPGFGRIIFRVGRPLYFREELAAWQRCQQAGAGAAGWQRRVRVELGRRITQRIMEELAGLSGKRYPFGQI